MMRIGLNIDVVCSKQDVVSLSAPESEVYAMTGGAHGIHIKNIFLDLQVEVTVRLETDILPAHPAFVDAVVLAD